MLKLLATSTDFLAGYSGAGRTICCGIHFYLPKHPRPAPSTEVEGQKPSHDRVAGEDPRPAVKNVHRAVLEKGHDTE
jgi:hypothetical protein